MIDKQSMMSLLREAGFHFNKKLGQNFLSDQAILDNIVQAAGVDADTGVLEIGPGAGTLTARLRDSAKRVLAIELDKRLIPVINKVAGGENVRIVQGDAMTCDIMALCDDFLGTPFDVVANLPYYITTPIIMRLLESNLPIRRVTVMVQKEVAQRICASPGGKDYGTLTVAVGYRMAASIALEVPAAAFTPPPQVDSALVRMDKLDTPPVDITDEGMFFRVVRSAFAMRRKTMANNLCAAFFIGKQQAEEILQGMGYDHRIRGEALSMSDFAVIANTLGERLG